MSRQLLVPDSVFCRQADPLPPLFPMPQEGDVYFNTFYQVMRIYTKEAWTTIASGWKRWSGTQAEYDAIAEKDPDVLYVIV